MDLTPDWIRTEVYHALSVHFPIAFLLLATLVKLFSSFFSRPHHLPYTGSLLLYIGVLAAWLAIYTGDVADASVSRSICDPTILKDHENTAWSLAYIFTAAAILDLSLLTGIVRMFVKPVRVIALILMMAGSGLLVYAGDLGASLVYQQAAGVVVPSENCEEFE